MVRRRACPILSLKASATVVLAWCEDEHAQFVPQNECDRILGMVRRRACPSLSLKASATVVLAWCEDEHAQFCPSKRVRPYFGYGAKTILSLQPTVISWFRKNPTFIYSKLRANLIFIHTSFEKNRPFNSSFINFRGNLTLHYRRFEISRPFIHSSFEEKRLLVYYDFESRKSNPSIIEASGEPTVISSWFQKPQHWDILFIYSKFRENHIFVHPSFEKNQPFSSWSRQKPPVMVFMVQRNTKSQTLSISRESNLHLSSRREKIDLFCRGVEENHLFIYHDFENENMRPFKIVYSNNSNSSLSRFREGPTVRSSGE